MKKEKKVEVVQQKDEEVPAKILATSIRTIAEGVRKMDAAGLSERAVVLLLSNSSGVSQREIKNVLWALRNLESHYLK